MTSGCEKSITKIENLTKCDICDKEYAQEVDYKRHMITVHG